MTCNEKIHCPDAMLICLEAMLICLDDMLFPRNDIPIRSDNTHVHINSS